MAGLDGRVVLLTRAGTPLSIGLARYVGAMGANLVLHDETADPGLADELGLSQERTLVSTDAVASTADAERLVAATVDRFGSIDALITGLPDQDLSDPALDGQEWGPLLARLIAEPLTITRAAAAAMAGRGDSGGCIVNLAAPAGVLAAQSSTLLSAVSAAIVGFNRSLGLDLCEGNVAVNAVVPIVASEINAGIFGANRLAAPGYDPTQLCAAIAYLCQPGHGLSGEVLSVGGGRFARYVTSAAPGYFTLDAAVEDIEANIGRVLDANHAVELKRATDELHFIDL